jgi:isopenicillin N synthase-like dioxygenase
MNKNKIDVKIETKKGSMDEWPEPIVRVQSLAESNLSSLPDRYIKPASLRPTTTEDAPTATNIPIIDLEGLFSEEGLSDDVIMARISEACRGWGFFQVVNHGVKPELMDAARENWREFFHMPVNAKETYSNSPRTYEGYGSRLGVEKGASLDWSDYYFLHLLPHHLKDFNKWPSFPPTIREVIDEYGEELVKLSGRIMRVLSTNLGSSLSFSFASR